MGDLATNKKAYFNYYISDKYEAGIVLLGSEVKSCLKNNVSLKEGCVIVENKEVFLINVDIAIYEEGESHEPKRKRKLLLHKREISKISDGLNKKGFSLIPLRMYTVKGKIKVELGLGKGKKLYDKREVLKEKDEKINMEREKNE